MLDLQPSLLWIKLEYPFIQLCRLQATEARVALSRIVTDKARKSTKNPPRFGHDSKESTSSAVVCAVNNIENLTQNSQSHNVQNVVANLNHSPTLNVLSRAEFKDCQININSTKK